VEINSHRSISPRIELDGLHLEAYIRCRDWYHANPGYIEVLLECRDGMHSNTAVTIFVGSSIFDSGRDPLSSSIYVARLERYYLERYKYEKEQRGRTRKSILKPGRTSIPNN
jgi:hypothetical protein